MHPKITVSNWIVAVYFLYMGFNIVTEWIYFFSWGAEVSPSFGMPQAASAILLGAFVWVTRKNWDVSALGMNREQIVGMMIIFLYGGRDVGLLGYRARYAFLPFACTETGVHQLFSEYVELRFLCCVEF